MDILQKKRIIDSLTPATVKVERVGATSSKVTFQCGCSFVEHHHETNPYSAITGQRYTDEQFAQRRYWIELCNEHQNASPEAVRRDK